MAQIEIKSGDAVRVTSHATIMGAPFLMLIVNDRPQGYISREQAESLRRVVKDPAKIAID